MDHASWFLVEEDSDKKFQAICNYLSLGQFELARALIRQAAGSSRVEQMLLSLICNGLPFSWVVSDSVPSSAHLTSMCIDLIEDPHCTLIPQKIRDRCAFDLTLAQVFVESRVPYSVEPAERIRSMIWETPQHRMLIRGDEYFYILSAPTEPSPMLSSEMIEWVFEVCRGSRIAGIAFLESLHALLGSTCSAQLSQVQAALVADCVRGEQWERLFEHLRFLVEFGKAEIFESNPLVLDLMHLLVQLVNGQSVSKPVEKFIKDCLSVGQSKKKKATVFKAKKSFAKPQLRQSFYEALSCAPTRLIDFAIALEDELTECPSFTSENFWDPYYNFLRVAKVHCLEYPLSTSIALVKSGQYELARDTLSLHFNQLVPLVVLVCWDDLEWNARKLLLSVLWESYLTRGFRTKAIRVENTVWMLAHRFAKMNIAMDLLDSEVSCDHIFEELKTHSLLFVLRPVLRKIPSDVFMAKIDTLPRASVAVEAEFDRDVAQVYFVLRTLYEHADENDALVMETVDQLCGGIGNAEIKAELMAEILEICFLKNDQKKFTINLDLCFALLRLLSKHGFDKSSGVLLRFLVVLRISGEERDNVVFPPTLVFKCPPKELSTRDPAKFIPRLLCSGEALVLAALALNDYDLAESICRQEGVDLQRVDQAREFARYRDEIDSGIPEIEDDNILADLAVCNADPLVSAAFLGRLTSKKLQQWASRLGVLLEAKAATSCAELILGIETLPNEPELLKDHLNRMHTQRSAIMSLVERVDLFRHGQFNHEQEDFLADAIRTLDHKDTVRSSFLIQFLQYLSKVCHCTETTASLFEVLSEEPADLVARLVFGGHFNNAQQLCELMSLDLAQIIGDHSRNLFTNDTQGYMISLPIVQQLSSSNLECVPLLCVERRTYRWPSSELFAFGMSRCSGPLLHWMQERADAWACFIDAYKILTDTDCSMGFTEAEEFQLSAEMRTALRAVADDSQAAMHALARFATKAHIAREDYLAALACLDEAHLSSDDHTALVGALRTPLSPSETYQLLWRVESGAELVKYAKTFCQSWDFEIALKTLELCLSAGEVPWVVNKIRVIRTMASIVQVCHSPRTTWQALEAIETESECVVVIEDLLNVHHHGLADEFLDIKKFCVSSVDALSQKIELSRLRFMYVASEDKTILLNRLCEYNHPLKASSLGVSLVNSLEYIPDRIRLGQLLLAHGILCPEDARELETQLASLTLLACGHSMNEDLLSRPDLILESLLFNGKTKGICVFLGSYPSWRNDYLLLTLAHKALGLAKGGERSARSEWILTGDPIMDEATRRSHQFARVPDVPLALKLVSLCDSESATNAMAIKQFCHELSLFIPQFLTPGKISTESRCLFKRLSFLQHAIVALSKDCLCMQKLTLIANIWTQCGLQIGLETFDDPLGLRETCNKLMDMDKLDLALRLCPDDGRILLRKVEQCLRLGVTQEALALLATQYSKAKPLSLVQLEGLKLALENRETVSLEKLKITHRLLAGAQIDQISIPQCVHLSRVDAHNECVLRLPQKSKFCFPKQSDNFESFSIQEICARFGHPESGLVFLLQDSKSIDEAIRKAIDLGLATNDFAKLILGPKNNLSLVFRGLKSVNHTAVIWAAIGSHLRASHEPQWDLVYQVEVAMGRDSHAALAAIQQYLRADSWDSRLGFLECAGRHLGVVSRIAERFRLRRIQRKENDTDEETDTEEETEVAAAPIIVLPLVLPQNDLLLESMVPVLSLLVSLQLCASELMPLLPSSASLFGSIQAVSELIDYLLMDNHEALVKRILTHTKLPDKALCGIFTHSV